MQLQSALAGAALFGWLSACGAGTNEPQSFRSAPSAAAYRERQTVDLETIDRVLVGWPGNAQLAARATIAHYGLPQEVTASMLIWRDNPVPARTIAPASESRVHASAIV